MVANKFLHRCNQATRGTSAEQNQLSKKEQHSSPHGNEQETHRVVRRFVGGLWLSGLVGGERSLSISRYQQKALEAATLSSNALQQRRDKTRVGVSSHRLETRPFFSTTNSVLVFLGGGGRSPESLGAGSDSLAIEVELRQPQCGAYANDQHGILCELRVGNVVADDITHAQLHMEG